MTTKCIPRWIWDEEKKLLERALLEQLVKSDYELTYNYVFYN